MNEYRVVISCDSKQDADAIQYCCERHFRNKEINIEEVKDGREE